MSSQVRSIYEFGPFRLDPTERLLIRNGMQVSLTPKAFQTLLVLIEHRGRLIGKDELMNQVWPDAFVEEGGLARNISSLRKALGERPDECRYIETVPKHGYRFVAQVRELGDESQDLIVERHVRAQIVTEEEEETGPRQKEGADARNRFRFSESGAQAAIETVKQSVGQLPIVDLNSHARLNRRGAVFVIATLVLAVTAISFALYKSVGRKQSGSGAGAVPFQTMKVTRLTSTGKVRDGAISPDGKYVVYEVNDGGQQSLWLRQVATTGSVQIVPPDAVNYWGVTFSPDGDYIYYSINEMGKGNSDRALYQIPVLGGAPRKLLVGVATPVTFSPDGKRFAFVRVSSNEGETSLMIANADGTGERRLASLRGDEWFSYSGPSWSPDGKVIASGVGSSNGGSHMTVVAVHVEDGTEREITSHRWSNLERIAWLADGSGLVLNAADQGTYFKQIWQLSYPGGEARRITNDLNNYHQISLTRDSSTLVTVQENETSNVWITPKEDTGRAKQITSGKDEGRRGISWTSDEKIVYTSDVSGNSDIWIMDQDGANQKQLTTDPRMDLHPALSPDGRYVVFSSNRTGTSNLWRMDIDGSNPKQLTGGSDDLNPQCSPDSRWVVFSSWEPGKQTLFKVPVDGGDPVQLTDRLSPELGVSPDGKLIACSYMDEEPNSPWRIMVIPFEGGQPIKTFDISPTVNPWAELRWTADGRALTYIDTRKGISNIWSQTLERGSLKQLTDFKSEQIYHFDWSRDGRQLALARGTVTSDVVMIKDFR